MTGQQWIKVDLGIASKFSMNEALLVGFLMNFSKTAEKDERGFFAAETAWIAESLGMSKRTMIRIIQSAASHHLVQYEAGKNQNVKPKFKLF